MNKPISADGVSGMLLDTFDGRYVFRVHRPDQTFVDYDLRHCDLSITIHDKDAFLYRENGVDKLDHSPETLGIAIP